jgi:hypothetical protein
MSTDPVVAIQVRDIGHIQPPFKAGDDVLSLDKAAGQADQGQETYIFARLHNFLF